MHEDPPRSATRGLPVDQRFNVFVCGRVCIRCHADCTAHRIHPVFADPVQRWAGPVAVGQGSRKLASEHHPDKGGRSEDMARINAARDVALKAVLR